eukprot:scaffold141986_cov29-Tisochrysis_lutea.AAC.15
MPPSRRGWCAHLLEPFPPVALSNVKQVGVAVHIRLRAICTASTKEDGVLAADDERVTRTGGGRLTMAAQSAPPDL